MEFKGRWLTLPLVPAANSNSRWGVWTWGPYSPLERDGKWSTSGELAKALVGARKRTLRWTAKMKDDLLERAKLAKSPL